MSFKIKNGVLEKYRKEKGVTEVVIPEGVTRIGDKAFFGCERLASITIPDGVTGIGKNAFYGCKSLTSITIPESVTSIGGGAFLDTPWLENYPDDFVSLQDTGRRV